MSVFTLKTSAGTSLFDVSDTGAVTLGGMGSLAVRGTGVSITADNGASATWTTIEGTATLSTSGATTTVSLDSGALPAGSAIMGGGARVTTAIAGTGAGASVAFKVNASATTLFTLSGLTANSTGAGGFAAIQNADEFTIVISGGAGSDNTPSAGAVSYTLFVLLSTAPTA
jgi:hypothetical protein